jgi:hypothetical protein
MQMQRRQHTKTNAKATTQKHKLNSHKCKTKLQQRQHQKHITDRTKAGTKFMQMQKRQHTKTNAKATTQKHIADRTKAGTKFMQMQHRQHKKTNAKTTTQKHITDRTQAGTKFMQMERIPSAVFQTTRIFNRATTTCQVDFTDLPAWFTSAEMRWPVSSKDNLVTHTAGWCWPHNNASRPKANACLVITDPATVILIRRMLQAEQPDDIDACRAFTNRPLQPTSPNAAVRNSVMLILRTKRFPLPTVFIEHFKTNPFLL